MRFTITIYRGFEILGIHSFTYSGNSCNAIAKCVDKYGYNIRVQIVNNINFLRSIYFIIDNNGMVSKSYEYIDYDGITRKFNTIFEFLDDCLKLKEYDHKRNVYLRGASSKEFSVDMVTVNE